MARCDSFKVIHQAILMLALMSALPWTRGDVLEVTPGLSYVQISRQYAAAYNNYNGVTYYATPTKSTVNLGYVGGDEFRALLKFPGVALPADAVIESVYLTLKFSNWGSPLSVAGSYMSVPWSFVEPPNAQKYLDIGWNFRSYNVPWSTPGAAADSTGSFAINSVTGGPTSYSVRSVQLDAAVVKTWADTPDSNNGILLRLDPSVTYDNNTRMSFDILNTPPKLTIQYKHVVVLTPEDNYVEISTQYAEAWNNYNGVSYFAPMDHVSVGTYDSYEFRGLLKFPGVSAIPTNANVQSAELALKFTNWAATMDVQGCYLDEAWSYAQQATSQLKNKDIGWMYRQQGVFWTQPGGKTFCNDFGFLGVPPVGAVSKTILLSSAAVNGWIASPSTNNGILLAAPSTSTYRSLSFDTATTKPKLTITFYLP